MKRWISVVITIVIVVDSLCKYHRHEIIHNNIFYDRFIASLFNRKMQNLACCGAHFVVRMNQGAWPPHSCTAETDQPNEETNWKCGETGNHTNEWIHRIYEVQADAVTDYFLWWLCCKLCVWRANRMFEVLYGQYWGLYYSLFFTLRRG